MKERWRLVVEGLGKIERAEVDIRPLMLFVGPNNTGKSYLASLLWGLVADQGVFSASPGNMQQQECDEWIARHVGDERPLTRTSLSDADIRLFDRLFRAALAEDRDSFVSSLFNDAVTVRRLDFDNVSEGRQAVLEWTREGLPNNHRVDIRISPERVLGMGKLDDRTVRTAARTLLMQGLTFGSLTTYPFASSVTFAPDQPVFLPASRTGFMQLYKSVVRKSLQGAFRPQPEDQGWLKLTSPTFHFLDMLAFGLKRDKVSERFAEEVDILERALRGRLELSDEAGTNEFWYVPEGAQTRLSMSLSSSLVTELAPFILVLRHLPRFPVLILEEPEAHLHPELQRRVAQVIVRLIRKGLYVWITTHSENLCQHINNFLKLGALDSERRAEAQQRLGYGPQDYLDLDEVAGYQFKLDERGERSFVEEMRKTPHGLVMPTFNTALTRIVEEVDYLDELVAEAKV